MHTLGPYCLLHTVVHVPVQYSWSCQVLKVPQYHGVYRTTVSTLFPYFVVRTVLMVMSRSTGSATVPWRLLYNSPITVLLFHPALSRRIVQYLQYFFIVVISLHFTGGVFPVDMLVGAFVSCFSSHIFFLLFCIPIRKIVTMSGVVCLNLFLCFNGIHAFSACVL